MTRGSYKQIYNFSRLSVCLLSPQMSVLSRQVAAVSQELQEMTRLLKPLYHSTSALLLPSAVTPPPSISSLSCSPAPALLAQHAPADCSDDRKPPPASVLEPSSPPLEALPGGIACHQSSPSQNPLLYSHRSAPSSLNCSLHEHVAIPPPSSSSSSIPSLSSSSHPSSVQPLLVDLSGTGSEPQTQPQTRPPNLSRSMSQLQVHQDSQCASRLYRHCLSQPLPQPSSMASQPLLDLEAEDLGTAQLSYINEGQSSV